MEEAKKEAAPEVPVQEQQCPIFIVSVKLSGSTYYLTDLEFSISKNVRDSILIISKENAYKLASQVESNYENSLGKVLDFKLNKLI